MKAGWGTIPLGEVCDFQGGSQPPKSEFIYEPKDGYVRLLQIRDFTRDDKAVFIPEAKTKRSCKIDDIMIARYGASVGQIHTGKRGSYNVALIKTIPDFSKLNRAFFYHYLKSDLFQKPLLLAADRSAQAGFSKADIINFPVPLPPLPEQRRIVEVLNAAFVKIDRLETITKQNIVNAEELFDSALKNILLKKDGWRSEMLVNITTKIGSGATPRGGQKSYKQEGLSLIRSLNVHDNEFRLRKLALIDDSQAEKLSNVTVEAGDVLLNITGASVARCCVVPQNILPARVNQHVSIIRPKSEELNSELLCYLLISPYYKDELLGIGEKGGSTRQAITKAQIQEFKVSFPKDKHEQETLVKRIKLIEVICHNLNAASNAKLAALSELRQSLLQKAFAGELVSDFILSADTVAIADKIEKQAVVIALVYENHKRHGKTQTYGHVKTEKIIHMLEAEANFAFDREPVQDAAGPNDFTQFNKVMAFAEEQKYFTYTKRDTGNGYIFNQGNKFSNALELGKKSVTAHQAKFDKIVNLMTPMFTREAEVLATIYSAWNNFLLEKKTPTDVEIHNAASNTWHEKKKKITNAEFSKGINTLRSNSLIPEGKGAYVTKKSGTVPQEGFTF